MLQPKPPSPHHRQHRRVIHPHLLHRHRPLSPNRHRRTPDYADPSQHHRRADQANHHDPSSNPLSLRTRGERARVRGSSTRPETIPAFTSHPPASPSSSPTHTSPE